MGNFSQLVMKVFAMSVVGDEKISYTSQRSSTPSKDSIARTVSLHDHENPKKDLPLEVLQEPIKSKSRGATSVGTTGTNDPSFEVDWDDDDGPDKMNPINWPIWYKGMTIGFISWSTFVVVVYSTSYTTGLVGMQDDFHVSSEPVVTLGITSYRKFGILRTWHHTAC